MTDQNIFTPIDDTWAIVMDMQDGSHLSFTANPNSDANNLAVVPANQNQELIRLDFSARNEDIIAALRNALNNMPEGDINQNVMFEITGLEQPKNRLKLRGLVNIACTAQALTQLKEANMKDAVVMQQMMQAISVFTEAKAEDILSEIQKKQQAYQQLLEKAKDELLTSKNQISSLKGELSTLEQSIHDLNAKLSTHKQELGQIIVDYKGAIQSTSSAISKVLLQQEDIIQLVSIMLKHDPSLDRESIIHPITIAIAEEAASNSKNTDPTQIEKTVKTRFKQAVSLVVAANKTENIASHWKSLIAKPAKEICQTLSAQENCDSIAVPRAFVEEIAEGLPKLVETANALHTLQVECKTNIQELQSFKQTQQEVNAQIEQADETASQLEDLLNSVDNMFEPHIFQLNDTAETKNQAIDNQEASNTGPTQQA